MDSYRIVATKRFLRRLKELDRKIRERVLRAIEEIAEKPYVGSALVFNGKRLYKYRVGNYRVVYEVDEKEKVVLFHVVSHRRRVYRGF